MERGHVVFKESLFYRVIDSQRSHVNPITDLASTSLMGNEESSDLKDVMVSGDQNGTLNLWTLGATKGDGLVHKTTMGHSDQDGPVTALSIWNRISKGKPFLYERTDLEG